MRFLALSILLLLPALPADAQERGGVTACRVETTGQSGDVIAASGTGGNCNGVEVTSIGQTGGITAGTVTITRDQSLVIEKPETGSIAICRTSAVLRITASRTTLVVSGGRRCRTNEEPTVVIDARTNAIIGGVNRGSLIINVE